jgi:squalene-hopene/tetraprenyl-beta-curcumene cyclase
MKCLGLFLLLVVSSASAANLSDAVNSTRAFILSQQLDGNHWSGTYTLDVSTDAIVLGLGTKLGFISPELKNEIIESIFVRMHPSREGWTAYPGGKVDFDVTVTALKFLEYSGIPQNDERVSRAWDFVNIQKTKQKYGILPYTHLVPMELLPREMVPYVPIKMLGLDDLYPMALEKQGIIHVFTVPYITWNYFYAKNHGKVDHHPLSRFGSIETTLNNVARASVVGSEEYWAQMGIKKILASQNPTGGWYALNFTYMNVLALLEAQAAGAGNFDNEIKRAWKKILSWRSRSFAGYPVQQSILSDIWDSASIANAFQYSGFEANETLDWLVTKSTNYADGSRGWSFDSNDRTYPDVDDTALVVHALAKSRRTDPPVQEAIQGGLRWLLKLQNSDGGFPAWKSGVSRKFFEIGRKLVPKFPEVEDVSQMDITGRVVHTLSLLEKTESVKNALKKACRFLEKAGEGAEGVPFNISKGHWYANYFYSASMQLLGVIHGECNEKLAATILNWLIANQNNDGGWGESNLSYEEQKPVRAHSTLSQTALVLVGLTDYYRKNPDSKLFSAIARGVEFLLWKSENGTNWWEEDFAGVVVKNYLFNRYELMPSYAGMYVLGQWQNILTKF